MYSTKVDIGSTPGAARWNNNRGIPSLGFCGAKNPRGHLGGNCGRATTLQAAHSMSQGVRRVGEAEPDVKRGDDTPHPSGSLNHRKPAAGDIQPRFPKASTASSGGKRWEAERTNVIDPERRSDHVAMCGILTHNICYTKMDTANRGGAERSDPKGSTAPGGGGHFCITILC